jgi:chromosome segregation ATPase
MTNPQPVDTNTRLTNIDSHLHQLDDEFETVKQLLISAASYAESANNRIDRLSERQDITQRQLDGLSVTVQVMGEKVDNFIVKVDEQFDRLSHKIDDFVDTTKARNAVVNNVVHELRDSQQSTNAAIERLERILEQLLRQKD